MLRSNLGPLGLSTVRPEKDALPDPVTFRFPSFDRQLSAKKTVSRLKVEGGWCAVLRVPATRSDEDLAIDLLKTHSVSVHPGHFYDFPSDSHVVLSLLTPNEIFGEGTKRLLVAA